MFYRVKNKELYDYADYEYAEGCLFSNICTVKQFEENKSRYIINENKIDIISEKEEEQQKQEQFEKEFFKTSLGWIRRKVTMKDGSVKDFLSDLLLPVKAGLDMGQNVDVITYKTPDFSQQLTIEYLKSLQEIKSATELFIKECLFQTVKDFGLDEGGINGI